MRFVKQVLIASFGLSLLSLSTIASESIATHGISTFGNLKYPADFKYFDFVNPDTPKGGRIKIRNLNSFDSLNPFILKGVSEVLNADIGGDLAFNFASLMTRAYDEPDSVYGLVAKEALLDPNGKWVEFHLRTGPTFHDGTPITPEDIAFSFNILKEEGHPSYKQLFKDIQSPVILGPSAIRFNFKEDVLTRGLALEIAKMPILSKADFASRPFNQTSFEPILGSGPYKIKDVQPGRTVVYERIKGHWAEDLPVHKGRYNFDEIQVDYYRDRTVALEAFFAGEYDFREEFTSRSWATQYTDKPAFKNGYIVMDTLKDESLTGFQAFFFNTRLEKFSDIRVRKAISRLFDFEWTNKNLFYGSYNRITSFFENSPMKATGSPSPEELEELSPWKDILPNAVFESAFTSTKTSGSEKIRGLIKQSLKDLKEAGWTIQNKKLVNKNAEQMTFEFLLYTKSFDRIINPFIRNLERIGIDARIRLVDVATWQNRMQDFDYEMATRRMSQPAYPGLELRNWWGSRSANIVGGLNIAGTQNPAIDALIEKIIEAKNKEQLIPATRALDRILMASHYTIPQWYKASHFVAYWDKFGMPTANKPGYNRSALHSWWYDQKKADRLTMELEK